jgi:uncharacterized membrane protein HdeD (DUF308 family)
MSTLQALLPQKPSRWSIVLSVLLIGVGVLAICLPALASIGFTRLLAWLILFDGVVQLFHAFRSQGSGRIAWKVLISVLYIGVGIWLLLHTLVGLAGLTLVLAGFFFAEGIFTVIAYFSARKVRGSAWMLLNGIITILLALMIWRHWPSSSLWAIGTLVGISMLMTGTTHLMMALAARRLARNSEALGEPEPRAA